MSVSTVLDSFFKAELAVLKSDFVKDVVPILQTANNIVASNPTVLNLIAQVQSVKVQIMALEPQVLQDEIKALDVWLAAELNALANPPPPPPAA